MSDNKLVPRPEPVVVKVISDYKIIIGRGSNDGIKEDQRFLVYAIGEELKDPADGRELGHLEIIRGRGKVVHLQKTMATVESIQRKVISRGKFPLNDDTYEDLPFEGVKVGDICRPI